MGEDCGGGARHPRGGMAKLLGADGGSPNATPAIPRKPQAGDFGEKMGGSSTMGWRPDVQEEIQDAGEPQTRRHSCWKHQEACLKGLPAEDRALPHRAVPALG